MSLNEKANMISSYSGGALRGTANIPGDKSISHRALIFGSLAFGKTKISGLLNSFDVTSTMDALRSLGVRISQDKNNDCNVDGVGVLSLIHI